MTEFFPVTWQMVVNTHDGAFHLFQLRDQLPLRPAAGMLLVGVPGIPSVLGPEAGCDNVIRRVLYDGSTKSMLCSIQGYRAATQTLAEVQAELTGPDVTWTHITRLANENVREVGPQNMLDDNGDG